GGMEAVRVRLRVVEGERIARGQPLVSLLEGARVQQIRRPGLSAHPVVMPTGGADLEVGREVLREVCGGARVAITEDALGEGLLLGSVDAGLLASEPHGHLAVS